MITAGCVAEGGLGGPGVHTWVEETLGPPPRGAQVAEYWPVGMQAVLGGQQVCTVGDTGQHVAPGIMQQPYPDLDMKMGQSVAVAGQAVLFTGANA